MKLKILFDVLKNYKKKNTHILYHDELKVEYILVNSEDKKDVIACLGDEYGEELYFYNPYKKEKARLAVFYDLEKDFFDLLADYDIVKISLDAHRSMWNFTEEVYEDSRELPDNLDKYLLYCRKRPFTVRWLKKKSEKDTMRFLSCKNKKG